MSKTLILLVHGWGGSKKSLYDLANNLDKYETANLELPGFGETPLTKAFDLSAYSEWLVNKINKYNLDIYQQVVVVGHSVGGKITLKSAITAKLPDSIKVVLINSSGIKPQNSLKKKIFKFITKLYSPIKSLLIKTGLKEFQYFLQKVFYKFIVRARDYEKLNEKPKLKKTFQNIINEHIDPNDLAKIKNETLLIWGEKDPITKLWMGRVISENIPNSELKIVPGGSHGLPLKQPDKVANLIKEFLKN